MTSLIYTGQFENFYEYPLNEEARACIEGETINVDRWLTRRGAPRRRALVLKVQDGDDGRRVTLREEV